MIDNGWVFAKDNKRVFINTSLGCNSRCAYCYLPKIGYDDSKQYKVISFKELISFIEKSDIEINENTLITIGCFGECLDKYNKKETISLIRYFLKRGNQVQLSTKQEIIEKDFKELLPLIKYYGQLAVFISSSTISEQPIIEKNTIPIIKRFDNFNILNKLNIPGILYMKPVLKGITIKDLELYKKYINQYNINYTVVGSIFSNNISYEKIHFSSSINLFYEKNEDEDIIAFELSKITKVYRRSSEIMKDLKINK